ncbi:uncharacterized protein LOC133855386 isoform X2 [Alnus glutinosa]|uniref:uncharacterized protein LOC133855386 isoform X2 n=1 Tax=Alnus glutinosa TaxID=3517 RepID=UPI002D7948D3|nr:uncharacterized protein LOC133855386 isoform X2 [Alnus glutinosa]
MEGNDNTTQKDYYKVLEVDYDASEEKIRLNYRRLALKWHPDKQKGDSAVTTKFQEINEAYKVLSDPAKRLDYDLTGIYEIDKYSLREYLARFKGMILTCNGLGISHMPIRSFRCQESGYHNTDYTVHSCFISPQNCRTQKCKPIELILFETQQLMETNDLTDK